MSSIKLSVIMPVFNEQDYVREAIESILVQTFNDFEFIIINDGSEDESLQIIESFNDKRIITINNNKNIGIAESLNKGINYSKGEYIARMDANDIAIKTRFEKQVQYLDNNDVGLIGTQYKIIDKDANILRQSIVRYFEPDETISYLAFYNICHSTIMLKREILLGLNYYYSTVLAEDFDLYQRLTSKSKFYVIKEKLMKIRQLSDGLSGQWNKIEKDIDRIRIFQINKIGITPTKEQELIHSGIVNNHYEKLEKYSISAIINWFEIVLNANNEIKFFPNPFFNNQLFIRLLRIFKSRRKNIRDILKYNKVALLMNKRQTLNDLVCLYMIKNITK